MNMMCAGESMQCGKVRRCDSASQLCARHTGHYRLMVTHLQEALLPSQLRSSRCSGCASFTDGAACRQIYQDFGVCHICLYQFLQDKQCWQQCIQVQAAVRKHRCRPHPYCGDQRPGCHAGLQRGMTGLKPQRNFGLSVCLHQRILPFCPTPEPWQADQVAHMSRHMSHQQAHEMGYLLAST